TDGDGETAHEEVYFYRFRPENGFGGQYWFTDGGDCEVHMTRSGDTFAFSDGFHPTVTSPGHEAYIFTILVGLHQRSLVQNFKEEHRHLMGMFPGVQDMVDKFK
ncbi:MAG: 5-deoxy-glucuronate isomerase, partial [Rhodospirillales bacterium]|nr:5-deoxy-glucuronate isomerase [Rhodospirillales bacterium]